MDKLKKEKWIMQILEKLEGAIAVINASVLQQGLSKLPGVKRDQQPLNIYTDYFSEDPLLYTNKHFEKIFLKSDGSRDALTTRIFEI